MATTSAFAGLTPSSLWKHFEVFTQTPRPSGREERIAAYVLAWANERGFASERDGAGNVIVRVPGTPGREKAPVVVIQGHLDMVCERNSDSPYDAEKDPLHVARDGEWLKATGTTLGADNGIGVAAGMAAADDPDVVHGPLELLMTLDEETGLTGAQNLDGSRLMGRTLLNLDSEDMGVLFVGCAGGCDTRIRFAPERGPLPAGAVLLDVAVSGLLGGHSGLDIVRNRANALHVLARVLDGAHAVAPLSIATLAGGSKRNAIPREATATIAVEAGRADAVREAIESGAVAIRHAFETLEPNLAVRVTATPAAAMPASAWTAEASARVVQLLRAIPSGVIAMSQDIPGLVETSTNLGVATTSDDGALEVITCSRSSVAEALDGVIAQIDAIAKLAGANAQAHGRYPGWKPNLRSHVLEVTKQAHARLFGNEPQVTAIHAGLECGLLGERVPGMDMVSFGPDIRGAHSPDERVHVGSVERFWKLLAAVLDDLSR